MAFFPQNCDFGGHTSLFHVQSYFLPFIFIINCGSLRFYKRKHFLRPKRVECTGNPFD